jgi:zinc/manganese transport system permease protein
VFSYDFMRDAFMAGTIVSVVAGAVGFFLVLRNLAFAGHALSHVGFAGATGAVLLAIEPLWGLLAFTLLAGAAIGLLGARLRQRDVAVGIILAFSLGLGVLFLHLYTAFATQATALLFGNVLGVSHKLLWELLILAVITLGALALMARPLLFETLDPELAAAKGVSPRLVSVLYLLIVAVAAAEAVQVVGILLIFALMVGPPAAALQLSPRLGVAFWLSIAIATAVTWLGIGLAYYTNWPTSFWITTLSTLLYGVSLLIRRRPLRSFASPV